MVKIYLNSREFAEINSSGYNDIVELITQKTQLSADEFYLQQNGKRISSLKVDVHQNVQCILRLRAGKGGFGSMLRAIGAQIEKTTNREACRDLSGRRLRDINEEKRLKAWLDKKGEREREAEERKKRKIEKLLAVPKHEFKDEKYEEARSKLTEKVNDAVEEGFKKVQETKNNAEDADKMGSSLKRKSQLQVTAIQAKKKKSSLWIGDDISDTDDSSNESSASENEKRIEPKKQETKC